MATASAADIPAIPAAPFDDLDLDLDLDRDRDE
jgi:hypothetical protein